MNYREFTERVYNYKHGLTNSAESQNIQHSTKEENNVLGENNNPEDNIMHSKLGDEWDQHKYIRKEYLGNNNWRYIYADGSSNVTNAANETQADEAESRSRATQIRSTNKSNYQAEQERKNAGTVGGNTPAPNTVPTPSQQAEEERRRAGTYNPASAIGEHLKANTQSPSNQAFVEGRNAAYQEAERKEAGTPSPEVKPNTLLGAELATKARKHEQDLENAKKLTAPDSMKQESAPNFADALKATNANTVSERQSTPLQQLTNQSVEATSKFDNKTNNPAAYNLLLDYSKGLKEAYDVLASKGYSDEEIDDIINTVEGAFEYPKGMYNQIKNFDNNGYINFMDGAEAGIQDAINDVVPELKNYAETLLTKEQQQARDDMRKFMEPLNVKEVEYLNAAQKAADNGELPVKEAVNNNTTSAITEKQENSWNNASSKDRGSIIQGIVENSEYMSQAPAVVKFQLDFGTNYAKGFAVGNISNSKPEYKEALNDPAKINAIYESDPEVRDMADKMLADMVEMWPETKDFVKRKLFLGING